MHAEFDPGLAATRPVRPHPVDIAPLVETVQRKLRGQVPVQRIESELQHLLQGEFAQARITAYLPIFLARSACESLGRELTGSTGKRA